MFVFYFVLLSVVLIICFLKFSVATWKYTTIWVTFCVESELEIEHTKLLHIDPLH